MCNRASILEVTDIGMIIGENKRALRFPSQMSHMIALSGDMPLCSHICVHDGVRRAA